MKKLTLLVIFVLLVVSNAYSQSKTLFNLKNKTVDFHAHPVTSEFRDGIKELGIDVIKEDGFPMPEWSVEAHKAFMAEAKIDYTVLSPATPHVYNGNNKKAREVARKVNQSIAKVCRSNPDSFGFVACLPLPDVKGAIEETKYAMDKLGAIGVKLSSNSYGVYIGDKSFEPLMAELNNRKALVIIHPARAREKPDNVVTGKVAAIYEYPADTTRAVLNMMANKVMTRYPNIKFVVPHVGSFLPYMLQRFNGVVGVLAARGMMEPVDIQNEFKNLYFDIAGDPETVALDMLLMVTDVNHVVYGSDFPYVAGKAIIGKKKHFENNEKYKPMIDSIYRKNAVKLLEISDK